MEFLVASDGEIRITELTDEERKRLNLLLDMADRKGNVFDNNGYVLCSLVNAEEESQKRNDFGELLWLRETVIRLQWRISNILKAQTGVHDKKPVSETPELAPCPRCGASAVLKYRGYLPDYFCSNEKCGNEGGMHETKEGAAYNWNTQKEREAFHKAVREVECKELPSQELERLAFFLLGEIMKKEGVIGERD